MTPDGVQICATENIIHIGKGEVAMPFKIILPSFKT
jgi:hypothetical protein